MLFMITINWPKKTWHINIYGIFCNFFVFISIDWSLWIIDERWNDNNKQETHTLTPKMSKHQYILLSTFPILLPFKLKKNSKKVLHRSRMEKKKSYINKYLNNKSDTAKKKIRAEMKKKRLRMTEAEEKKIDIKFMTVHIIQRYFKQTCTNVNKTWSRSIARYLYEIYLLALSISLALCV